MSWILDAALEQRGAQSDAKPAATATPLERTTATPPERTTATPLERTFALRQNLFEDFRRFYALFWEQRLVDPVILELCRLRIAQIHSCEAELSLRYRPALDAGLSEQKIAALPDAAHSDAYSEAERACVAFAELFAIDPHAIDDRDAARVVAALGDAGTVALVEALALFDGFARFRLMLGVEPSGAAPRVVPAPRGDAGPLY